ncbi:MAG: glycosyltransferase [Proteobacteria bacterium]|nr:glycosyltransferase [Pseudomonadota bacterium]
MLDIFVIPSYREGLAIAGLDTMARGCSVVATPLGSG